MAPRAAAVLVLLGAVWGASFLFIKVVVDETTPLQLVAGRHLFGALALVPIVWARGLRLPEPMRMFVPLLLLAVFASALPFLLISWAQEHIESGITSVLNSTMPLFTTLFAVAFLEEDRLSVSVLAGLLLGFAGVLVLSSDDLTNLSADGIIGHLAVIAAAASYGASNVYTRAQFHDEDRVSISVGQLWIGTLLLVPASLAVDGAPNLDLSTKAWLSWLTLGALSTAGGSVAYYWLIREVGSVRSSIVTYIIPVVGLALGAAVLDEHIGVNAVLGAALIVMGVAAAMGILTLRRQGRQVAPALSPRADPPLAKIDPADR